MVKFSVYLNRRVFVMIYIIFSSFVIPLMSWEGSASCMRHFSG